MKQILIRDVPDELHAAIASSAERERRSMEKEALRRLELSFEVAAETCGEMADRLDSLPPPNVSIEAVDSYMASRGRRSKRP